MIAVPSGYAVKSTVRFVAEVHDFMAGVGPCNKAGGQETNIDIPYPSKRLAMSYGRLFPPRLLPGTSSVALMLEGSAVDGSASSPGSA